ncbi:FGGY family carbohydrate kinase [Hydrogenoanaerobacterium sp.]|uniref:sedoheptulokinase n=1 Tax=Hydrogenoanaerobacterium sp. TaxID=2953763 RepID=UPI00289AEB37|nr:FGGY family carbohydrate kinase [Hydrogenoanaerobacterium sp.]
MRVIGIDIGTTTVCASVIDSASGEVLTSRTLENDAFIAATKVWEKLQDPAVILAKCEQLIGELAKGFAPIGAIGVTGQMHGILYVDEKGCAVSPLYIWQDGRGDREYRSGESYAAYLSRSTGYKLATGFGSVTHFCNVQTGDVPQAARRFCTIPDFIAMRLSGRTLPLVHTTNAASLGLFDLENACFDRAAIEKEGMDFLMFPNVTDGFDLMGRTTDGIPVAVSIGDNQASFIGSVRDMQQSILVNVGTGSQISYLAGKLVTTPSMETRPCGTGEFLLVGSSLCGGRAYAILKNFFAELIQHAGCKCDDLYAVMGRLAEGYQDLAGKLEVSTKFSGTRDNPDERGSISNIGIDNFTPQHITAGVLEGIVNELYTMYRGSVGQEAEKSNVLVGSGNGIRQNKVLQQMFAERFGMPVQIPVHTEEAAYGAALFAMVGVGCYPALTDAQQIIKYQ